MTALLTLAVALLAGTLLAMTLMTAIRLYEQQRPPRLSRAQVSSLLREWGALTFVSAVFPLNFLAAPAARPYPKVDPDAAPPVLLVPGYGLGWAGLLPLAAYLRRRGRRWVWPIGLPMLKDDPEVFARHVSRHIELLRRLSGAERIDVVGHSMGGIIAAAAIAGDQRQGNVRRLVTLGTPWKGTKMHVFGIGRQVRALAPDAPFLARAVQAEIPITAVYSDADAVVLPTANAVPTPAEPGRVDAILLENVGHQSLALSSAAFRAVEAALRLPDRGLPDRERGDAALPAPEAPPALALAPEGA